MQEETQIYVENGDHRYLRLVKGKNVIKKIMTINKLPIPDVLIDIIKDYLFVDEKYIISKFKKTYLVKEINTLIYESRRNAYYHIGSWNLRNMCYPTGIVDGEICLTCGRFTYTRSFTPEYLKCNLNCSSNWSENEEEEEEEEEEDWDW